MLVSDTRMLSPDSRAAVRLRCQGTADPPDPSCRSDSCSGEFSVPYRDMLLRAPPLSCDDCCRLLRRSGAALSALDNETRAYFLGWAAMASPPTDVFITLAAGPSELMAYFATAMVDAGIEVHDDIDLGVMMIASRRFAQDVRACIGEAHDRVPRFDRPDDAWAFFRGCIDASTHAGLTSILPGSFQCNIDIGRFTEPLAKLAAIPHRTSEPSGKEGAHVHGCAHVYEGTNCIDLMGKLYASTRASRNKLYRNYYNYLQCMTNAHGVGWNACSLPILKVTKTLPDAVLPSKTNHSDVGYDLTVVRRAKQLSSTVALYDTGLRVSLPPGHYAEVLPRSSLSKSGFVLANSVGVIDPGYTGNLLVALARIDPDASEPDLPFRCCQLVVRRQHHVEIEECAPPVADAGGDGGDGGGGGDGTPPPASARGAGGFGSTGGSREV